jgi:glutaredoxin
MAASTGPLACQRVGGDVEDESAGEGAPAGVTPKPKALPPLELRDETADLLLTWIDEAGDFHVVQKISEVPAGARDRVRVVVTTNREGTGDRLYVANLNQKRPDGTYEVTTLARSEWDAIGADKRKKRLEALAPSARPPEPAEPIPKTTATGLSAVIYGAEWCRPCHQAENLLKSLGVNVVKKDIDESPEANREMQKKLRQAGRSGGSIPVIDLGGKVFVGFDGRALRQAVEASKRVETL